MQVIQPGRQRTGEVGAYLGIPGIASIHGVSGEGIARQHVALFTQREEILRRITDPLAAEVRENPACQHEVRSGADLSSSEKYRPLLRSSMLDDLGLVEAAGIAGSGGVPSQ